MACTGKYKLTLSENFEDFMKALGVGLITRKLGNKTSPTVTITEEGGEYTFKQESIKTSQVKFKIGEEFEEVTADGRKVMSTMTLTAPNVMVHEMKGTNGGKDSTCIREFLGATMVATCKVDDIETVRTYSAV
eukprot:GFUD01017160.1.p2 GENE.GFUD01017160.1~~GFUD01017160.1.p2  ORF type:complete len:133 (+),score=38.44 GFUD01017160.1:189-587(+)